MRKQHTKLMGDIGEDRAIAVPAELKKTKVYFGSEAQTCQSQCPHFEGQPDDPNFIKNNRDRLVLCFELGGAMSEFLQTQEIVICPVQQAEGI